MLFFTVEDGGSELCTYKLRWSTPTSSLPCEPQISPPVHITKFYTLFYIINDHNRKANVDRRREHLTSRQCTDGKNIRCLDRHKRYSVPLSWPARIFGRQWRGAEAIQHAEDHLWSAPVGTLVTAQHTKRVSTPDGRPSVERRGLDWLGMQTIHMGLWDIDLRPHSPVLTDPSAAPQEQLNETPRQFIKNDAKLGLLAAADSLITLLYSAKSPLTETHDTVFAFSVRCVSVAEIHVHLGCSFARRILILYTMFSLSWTAVLKDGYCQMLTILTKHVFEYQVTSLFNETSRGSKLWQRLQKEL
jgi:hypothetical protein